MISWTTNSLRLVGCTATLCLLAGCGGDGSHWGASGLVHVDGAPLDAGTISFLPLAGGEGNSAGAGIENGRYRIADEPGLAPGVYKVDIRGFRKSGRKVSDPDFGEVDEIVSIAFRDADSLQATISSSGENSFDFHLTTAPR